MKIKNVLFGLKKLMLIFLQLHSKAPTKEIKRNWEIFGISGIIVLFLTVLSGTEIFNIKISFPFSEILNINGGFIFFTFVVLFCIVFFKRPKTE